MCVCVRPWALHIWDEIKALLTAHVSHFWLASSPLNVLGLIQEKRVFKITLVKGKREKKNTKKQPKFYILGWHFSLNMNDLIIITLSERWVMKVQKSSDRERLWTCLSHVVGVYIMPVRGKKQASSLHPLQETKITLSGVLRLQSSILLRGICTALIHSDLWVRIKMPKPAEFFSMLESTLIWGFALYLACIVKS